MRYEERVEPTEERKAKGGVRVIYDPEGRYCRTEVLPDTILGWLIHRELVDAYYADVAGEFGDWRRAFLRVTAHKTQRLEPHQGYQGNDLSSSRYILACAKLGNPTTQFLLDATEPGWDVCPAVSPNDYLWALRKLDRAMQEAVAEI